MQILSIKEQDDGSALLEFDVDILEYVTFVRIGHKTNPKEFDDAKCFEYGVIKAIKAGIEYEEDKSSRS